MSRKTRQPTSLTFLGWRVEREYIEILVRLTAMVEGKGWVQYGPLLRFNVHRDFLLQDDVSNAANSAWHHQQQLEVERLEAEDRANQRTLF